MRGTNYATSISELKVVRKNHFGLLRLGYLKLEAYLVGQPYIVAIKESDPLPARACDPCITRFGYTAIRCLNMNQTISDDSLQTPKQVPSRVSRTIVYDDQFPIVKVLSQDASNGPAEAVGTIVSRDNYADACHRR
jgi:hypothetical protein